MLRFNTFRARRYLRTRFVEGNFLLASEASDLELEILDLLRTSVRNTMGDVAISDAWKVERLTDTSVLVKPGEAWLDGLPFFMRYGKDQKVSGAVLSLGSIPVGMTATDHPDGLGKIINFNDSDTTPTNNYRFVVTALEELITDSDDAFLKNANLTESTGQKVRLNYQLNIVPVSTQDNSPLPYRDENSSSGGPITNYPDTGGTASPNYVNEISVTPTAGGNGEQISLTVLTGSEQIDGRDLEIVLRNDSGLGGGNPIPNSPAAQQKFSNGKLIDSHGSEFHINAIFNDTVSTQVVLRIDKEPGQPNPEIINTKSFRLVKRAVYTTDDVNGAPQGRLHWSIADVDWDSTSLLSHQSKITDLRTVIEDKDEFQFKSNVKDNLMLVEGGDISFNATTGLLAWTDDIKIKSPFSSDNIITASFARMLDGSSLVYELDLNSGGTIEKGSLAVNVTTGGTTITVDPVTFEDISVGNVVSDSAGTLAHIQSIDPDTNQMTVSTSLTTGAGSIFLDQYFQGTAKLSVNSFNLATRSGNKIYIGGGLLELEDGESSQIGDGVRTQLLTFVGSVGDADSDPNYSSTTVISQGSSLTTAIGALDSNVGANNTAISNLQTYTGADDATDTTPDYSSDIRGTANESLESRTGVLTDAVGDSQEDRSAFLRSTEDLTWTGTQLEFTTDIVLEVLNTKSGTLTTHTIALADSPVTLANGESLYVLVDRTANETVSFINSGVTPIPAQTQANKDIFVLFKRIDESGQANLYLPFSKQLVSEGKVFKLGEAGGGSEDLKATFLDPLSTALPTGSTVTIDGISGSNGDLVLFTNLVSDNNRVYELNGVGSSITWTPIRFFNGAFDASDGDSVRILQGDAFREQLATYDGTDFLVNDVVRYFDGVSADFWELSSIKTTTLSDNTTGNVFSVNVVGSENIIVSYSLARGANKETGEIYITSDGTNASLSRQNAYINDVGIDFTPAINSGDIELNFTSTSTGNDATMKYFVKRWSNSAGGPTGIPSYSGVSGSSVAAAGAIGDIQFKDGSGNLGADPKFKWDDSNDLINLNGYEYSALSSTLTINDNQVSPATLISFPFASYPHAIVEYSIERNGEFRTGTIQIASNSSSASDNDLFVETAATGITLSADIVGSNVEVRYTSTSTGSSGSFKYVLKKWI